MMKNLLSGYLLVAVFMLTLLPMRMHSQTVEVKYPVKFDVSIPLRDMKPAKSRGHNENEERVVPNRIKNIPVNLNAPPDPALQTVYPGSTHQPLITNPIVNFDGIKNSSNSGRATPPDATGDVGPNHYVQVVNCELQMFNKTGTSVYGPVTTSTIWSGFSGNWNGHNDGDAVVLYDENADRWLISQFAVDCGSYPSYTEYELVAISTTNDPTGTYYRYAFQFDYMPDYPKLGVWSDGYYLAVNRFNTNSGMTPFIGAAAAVLNRTKMLIGDPSATMQYFKTETLGGSGSGAGGDCWSMLPSDCDGTFAAAGTPNYFTYINDNSGGGSSELRVWALHADWTTPANSTFTYVTNLPVTSYTMMSTGTGVVPQSGTTTKLDGLGDRLMNRNQYKNFGTYESFVTCHSVNIGSGIAGVRWYEYRKTGSSWSVYQQGTYNPGDGKYRWLGSIAQNNNGDMALAYTVSNSSSFPSIYYTGRRATDALGTMTITEGIIQTGTVAMTGATRWGDYASTNVDPSDNLTFWTTNEYVGTYGGSWPWATKIASLKWSNQPTATTTDATAITATSATLNGTINPNGIATTYHFEWGTTTSYGNNTTTASAGSGTSTVPETANISGLTAGTTYHFRISGTNTDGTSNGADFTFTPGAANVTTTAATAVAQTTATAGGNVVTDGGSTVTARGTCYGTSANPTITGSHTTDGSGTGTFASSLSGLTANTTYHHRAYATNSTATFYGADLTFTTTCASSTLPFSESFSGTTIPGCWSQVDHQGNNQVWQFGTITTQSPNPALTGNYAFLNSRAYGSGNSQNADLVSPTIDMTGYTNVTLQFNHYFKSGSGSTATLSYSTNNGSSWTTIQTYTTTSSTNPTAFSQVIAALAGQSQVKIKWNYTGTYGYSWAIDDVQITGTVYSPTLAVTPPNQNVNSAAGNTTFNVASNSSWTVASNQTWCTVTPSGSGNGSITATYTDNTTGSTRVANITTTVTGLTPVVVTVTQSAISPTLGVTPPNQNVTAVAGNTTFNVASNSNWNVASDQTWCTVTPSGTGNGTITATYTDNTTLSTRIANITTTVTGITPVVVTVTQSGAAPTLNVTPSNQNVASPAGSTTFSVTSNSSWSVTSDQSWCSPTSSGSGNGTIIADYMENTGLASRVANLTVTVSGVGPIVVTVTQGGTAPTLNVTPSNQDVGYMAGTTSFNVASNSNWTAVSDQAWCTVTPSGTGNGTISANYTENSNVTPRMATVTVTVAGLSPVEVTVSQDGYVGIPELSAEDITIIPNPSDGMFTLNTKNLQKQTLVVNIYDQAGRFILSGSYRGSKSYQFDFSSKPKGEYLIRISTENGNILKKLILK